MTRALRLVLADAVRLFAGAERFVLDAAVGLRQRGHQVTVQAYPQSPLHRRALEAGVPVWPVATRADFAPWTVAGLVPRLRRHRPDVVLTAYEKDLRTLGLATRLTCPESAVIHSRECDVPLKNRPHYRWFYERVADEVLTNSQATRRTTLASAPWLDPVKVSVLMKGIEISAYQNTDGAGWRERLDVPPGAVVLGFAGQLVPRKRVAELLQLLAGESLRRIPWILAIAGDGPRAGVLKELAQRLDLSSRLRWCGWVEPLAPWLASLDVFVLNSQVEGFGYVLAEAAACSVPVAAMDASSVPEVVDHGVTGLLAPTDRPGALGEVLAALLANAELRRRLGAAGPAHVRRHFSRAGMVERLEAACGRAVANRRERRARRASVV